MKLRTACNRDCPDACTLEAEVVDGKLVSLKGSHDDPITKGFLCPGPRVLWSVRRRRTGFAHR